MTAAPLDVVFLAAGFATRLYPLTLNRAKPLLEVGGEPLLGRIVRQVAAIDGVRRGVVVSNGKFSRDFESFVETCQSPLPLKVVDDGALDNDARLGAIRDLELGLLELANNGPEPRAAGYLVLACDNLFDFDLGQLVRGFRASGVTQLTVRTVPEPVPAGRYSEVVLDGNAVTSFREKPADPRSNLSAIAAYVFPAELPERIEQYLAAKGDPDAPGHLLAWWSKRWPLEAHRLTGRFWDIGNQADLQRANTEFEG